MLTFITFILATVLNGGPQVQPGPSVSVQVDSQIVSAQKLMETGKFREALGVLSALAAGEKALPADVFMLLATCHLNLAEREQAFEVFERGMSIYPQQPVMEEFYIRLLTNYVPVAQMRDKLEKALTASPDSLVLLRASAFVEMRVDAKNDRARIVVERLVELAPDNPDSYYVRGLLASLNKQDDLAISDWEKALSLANDDVRIRMDIQTLIGETEDRRNRADRAEAAFKKGLEANLSLEQHNPASAFFYADFLARQARFDESQRLVELILGWAPAYGPALLQKASHLARLKKLEEAALAAEQALAGKDLNPQQTRAAHLLLARTYFQLKRMPEAERHQQWLKEQ